MMFYRLSLGKLAKNQFTSSCQKI